jgi:tRNA wybutosine-synthesizing protein 2
VRVRARVARSVGVEAAARLPVGFQRLGRVLVLTLPEGLRPHFPVIGRAWRDVLGVEAVLRRSGEVGGELRIPRYELIAGDSTETEVVEHGIRYRFDAARILFARGNREERHRAGLLTRPHDVVVDLFAGIGYFALPAAVQGHASAVWAVEKNPSAFGYLVENARRNRVDRIVRPRCGDNRTAEIPKGEADRVFLGYLPDAVPWIPRALELARPEAATLHVHLVAGTREGPSRAEGRVAEAVVRQGWRVRAISSRPVKSYGPGREHRVVDVTALRVGPSAPV